VRAALAGALAAWCCGCGGEPGAGSTSTDAAGSEEEGTPWFEERARLSGLEFRHSTGASGGYLFPETLGGAVALFDADGDADLDLFLGQGGSLAGEEGAEGRHRLFENRGAGSFTDVTEGSGVDVPGYSMGVAVGDVDGDGLEDLYLTNVGPNVLLLNRGGGRFEDVTEAAGVGGSEWSTSACFVDYDVDGDLDLFVCNYVFWSLGSDKECFEASGRRTYCGPHSYNAPIPDRLYRNEGGGRFVDASADSGISSRFGNGLGVVAADFNDDGLPDFFVANDRAEDQLWIGLGDGTFRDDAYLAGVAVGSDGAERAGMGVDAADVDDDGDTDLIVVNLHGELDGFYRNEGRYFVECTTEVGIGAVTRKYTRFGVGFVDFDNDGDLDLYEANGRVTLVGKTFDEADPFAEPNALLERTEGGKWRAVQPVGGTSPVLIHTSRGAAFGDVDGDGGVDIVVANSSSAPYLLLNRVGEGGHWLRARAVAQSGAAALGARVTLAVGGRTMRRDIRAGYSYCSSSEPVAHFGLGEATGQLHLEVRWTDGSQEGFGPFAVDQQVTLVQGEGKPL